MENMRMNKWVNIALAAVLLCLMLGAGCGRTVTTTVVETGTVTSTILSTTTVTVQPAPQLTLEVTSPQNGETFDVNVQKVSGIVSDPAAIIKVNGMDACVSQDGSFYGFADLPRGDSVIEVLAIRGDDNISQEVAVTFNPPLAVYLDLPQTSAGVDYRITPVTVTGAVNYPQASVTVDGNPVEVASDGTFTTQVMLKPQTTSGGMVHVTGFSATATLDGQTSSYSWALSVSDTGAIFIAPGQGILHSSIQSFPDEIKLQAGESQTAEGLLQTRVDAWPTGSISYSVSYGLNGALSSVSTEPVPLPDGLKVNVMPADFTLYPCTIYTPLILVEAAPQLPPGEYYVTILSRGPWLSNFTLRIVVTEPAATT
jgi:hypothetical protein